MAIHPKCDNSQIAKEIDMKFKIEIVGNGEIYRVLTKNGKIIAECRTMKSADRVAKGLQMELEYRKSIEDFRL